MNIYIELWDENKCLTECNSTENINGGEAGEYEKDFMKIKFNSDDNLPLNKILKLHNLIIVVRSVFKEGGKYYSHVFVDDTLYKVRMLEYDRFDISERIDINKTNASNECDICNYCYFKDIGVKYEPYLCNACQDLMEKAI